MAPSSEAQFSYSFPFPDDDDDTVFGEPTNPCVDALDDEMKVGILYVGALSANTCSCLRSCFSSSFAFFAIFSGAMLELRPCSALKTTPR